MSRQTECRDYSDGLCPGMAVIRANKRYRLVHVAKRLSVRLVVLDRYAEGCPPRTKLADALADLVASMARDGKHPEGKAPRLSPFAVSFGWLLLAYGAVQRETALRLEIDPVCGLVGYVSQLAGEIRFIGETLLSCDPLDGEETLLDNLRGTTTLARFLPDPTWYCFERVPGEAGGACYRFFFNTARGSAQDQRERLVEILDTLAAQALCYSPQAVEGMLALFERMWKMGWHTEDWQPLHIRKLFGSTPSAQYEHLLHESFETCTMRARGGET